LIFRRRPRPPAEPGAPQTASAQPAGTKPADDKRTRPRGLRPLPVVALCCVVAVLAVMMTRAVGMPLYSSGGAHAGTPDATDTQVDAATGEQSDDPDESDGTDQPSPDEPGVPTTAPATNPTTGGAPPPAQPAAPPVSRPGPPSNQPPPPPAPPPHSATPSPPPPPATSYEAESSINTLAGASVVTCSGCSGGKKVGHVGHTTGTLRFNQVVSATTANRTVTISYVNGDPTRTATLSVDGGAPIMIDFPGSGGWSTVRTIILTLPLTAGPNTLTFASDGAAPDFDRITVD
jgi:hypothetical protein